MNATFPAAMGNRWVAVMRVYDAILGCLDQAVPGGIAAAGSGQAGIISVASVNERTGQRHVSVVEPFIGGSGGRSRCDGVDGIDQPVGFLKSAPAEIVEVETPLVIRRFALEPGSAAPGRYPRRLRHADRDGEPQFLRRDDGARARAIPVPALGHCRRQRPARRQRSCSIRGGTQEREIGRIDVLELERGDVLRMITPSGGGYGDPFTRDPARVLEEVLDGLLVARAGAGAVRRRDRGRHGRSSGDRGAARPGEARGRVLRARPGARGARSEAPTGRERGARPTGHAGAGRRAHPPHPGGARRARAKSEAVATEARAFAILERYSGLSA